MTTVTVQQQGRTATVTIEGFDPVTVELSPAKAVRDCVSLRWANALTDGLDDGHAEAMLTCEAASHCGKLIVGLVDHAEAMRKYLNETGGGCEAGTYDDLDEVVRAQAHVWLFG